MRISQPFLKTAMVQSHVAREVLKVLEPHDVMIARRMPTGACRYVAWPGTPMRELAAGLVDMPMNVRTIHSIFGREGSPVNIALDLDDKFPVEISSDQKRTAFKHAVLQPVLESLHRIIQDRNETVESQLVLTSHSESKVSFHIHVALKEVAFHDYRSMQAFLVPLLQKFPNLVDPNIYRNLGMLRLYSALKEDLTRPMVGYCVDDRKINFGFQRPLTPAEGFFHSFIIREKQSYSRMIQLEMPAGYFRPAGTTVQDTEVGKRKISVTMPLTTDEAIENTLTALRNIPETHAGQYKSWITVLLHCKALSNEFGHSMFHGQQAEKLIFDEFVEFSKRSPEKFKGVVDCRKQWNSCKGNTRQDWNWFTAYKALHFKTIV